MSQNLKTEAKTGRAFKKGFINSSDSWGQLGNLYVWRARDGRVAKLVAHLRVYHIFYSTARAADALKFQGEKKKKARHPDSPLEFLLWKGEF